MLDANVCIRVLRERSPSLRERFIAEAGFLAISTLVLYELQVGVHRSADPARQGALVDEFVAHLTVAEFDRAASAHAAEIRAKLLAAGNVIGPIDLLIAGHARSLGLKLITGNLREFSRVEGLHCEDWV